MRFLLLLPITLILVVAAALPLPGQQKKSPPPAPLNLRVEYQPDPEHPGYRRVRIVPQLVRDLNWASGSIETQLGPLSCSWSRSEDSVRLDVVIPTGMEAEIHVPKQNLAGILVEEGGRPVWKDGAYVTGVPGITGASQTDRAVIFQAGSGQYSFRLSGN